MHAFRSFLFAFLCAPFATAQSFNIDVGKNYSLYPVPMPAYGAAAGQTGTWNDVHDPYTATLARLDGSASSVTTSSNSAGWYNYFPSTLTGDDYDYMVDIQNLANSGGPWSWTISGLQSGDYAVYTYAWAPENSGHLTRVQITGSTDPAQDVGGIWGGSPHVLGVTYALHHVAVAAGTIAIQVEGLAGHDGSVNGFQLVFLGNGTSSFCFGDGTGTACPCGNSGAAGNGCANSVNALGANVTTTGIASIAGDTLVLAGSGMPNAAALYFQGTQQVGGGAGTAFGDGLRCATGGVVRLGTKVNVSGASSYPTAGDTSVSVHGGVVASDVRAYQVWYRNPATFCTSATYNLSNGVLVTWNP